MPPRWGREALEDPSRELPRLFIIRHKAVLCSIDCWPAAVSHDNIDPSRKEVLNTVVRNIELIKDRVNEQTDDSVNLLCAYRLGRGGVAGPRWRPAAQ